jgi:hypothetical protein
MATMRSAVERTDIMLKVLIFLGWWLFGVWCLVLVLVRTVCRRSFFWPERLRLCVAVMCCSGTRVNLQAGKQDANKIFTRV